MEVPVNEASSFQRPARLPANENFFRAFPFWLGPALLALALTLIYLNPFIGDWDGLDYTVFSLRGEPSSMALGRSLFTLFNHGLFKLAHAIFGVQPERAYLLFKYAVVAQTPLAVIVCWVLARDLTGSVRSATVAALMVALSPMLVIYGGQDDRRSIRAVLGIGFGDSSARSAKAASLVDSGGRRFAGSRGEPARDSRPLSSLVGVRSAGGRLETGSSHHRRGGRVVGFLLHLRVRHLRDLVCV
jgi:hypothetical protein